MVNGRQLFADHVVGSQPTKRKKNASTDKLVFMERRIIINSNFKHSSVMQFAVPSIDIPISTQDDKSNTSSQQANGNTKLLQYTNIPQKC